MSKTNRASVYIGVSVYAILFVLISLLVFMANDEGQPMREIFQWGYLIPVTFYSIFSLWVSFGLFLSLKKIFTHFLPHSAGKIMAFALSLIIGIPVGLNLLVRTLSLILAH